MRIFQPIISGSAVITGNLEVAQGITGSLFGTASYAITASYVSPTFISASAAAAGFGGATVSASYASTASYYGGNVISASYALTASYVNTLNQNVLIVNSLTIGTSSLGSNENTLVLGPSPAGGTGEGGQILLQASGGLYTSASMWDNYQNSTRLLRGTNAGSDAMVASFNMHTKQVQFPAYTNASAFVGTATANLAVDSGGNIITVSTSGGTVFPYTGNAVITGSLTATTAIYAQANGAMYFRGGDDVELWDINISNHLGIYGQQDATVASVKLGSGGGVISGKSGNIGIGTINPTSASLTVNGNVWATSYTGSLFGSASYALTASYALNGGGGSTNTGSLLVTASVSNNTITFTKGDASTFAITVNSGSLFGTASWAQNAVTASYVLNSISSSYSATASYVNTLNQNVIVNGAVTASYIIVSGSGSNVNRLLVIGSGSNIPLFTVQGSSGELFSITDSLTGSLFSVNDISGLPIIEAFSDGIVTIGNPTAPSLYTTVKVTSVVGNNTIYSIPTSSYDGAWFEYTIKSGSNARAGQLMSIWGNGGNVRFTETTTTDIGSTSGVAFTAILSGANLLITGSTSTANWTIKGIVRSI